MPARAENPRPSVSSSTASAPRLHHERCTVSGFETPRPSASSQPPLPMTQGSTNRLERHAPTKRACAEHHRAETRHRIRVVRRGTHGVRKVADPEPEGRTVRQPRDGTQRRERHPAEAPLGSDDFRKRQTGMEPELERIRVRRRKRGRRRTRRRFYRRRRGPRHRCCRRNPRRWVQRQGRRQRQRLDHLAAGFAVNHAPIAFAVFTDEIELTVNLAGRFTDADAELGAGLAGFCPSNAIGA